MIKVDWEHNEFLVFHFHLNFNFVETNTERWTDAFQLSFFNAFQLYSDERLSPTKYNNKKPEK